MALDPKDCNGDGVYVIKCEDYYKMGRTFNLSLRLSQLQTSSPIKLEVVFWLSCRNSRSAANLETKIQKAFSSKRVNGEWYWLLPNDLRWIEKQQAERPIKKPKRRHDYPKPKSPSTTGAKYHPDWHYWNWKEAWEPWQESKKKESK